MTPEEQLVAAEPRFAPLVAAHGPFTLTPEGVDDLFGVLARVILYQQLSGKAAQSIERRLMELFPGREYPDPAVLQGMSDEELRACGVSRQKAGYLRDLARHALADFPTLGELHALPDEEIIERLTVVKGVGRWTVEMLLIFRLGRPDVWPVDDLGVRKGLMVLDGRESPPTRKEMIARGEAFRPFRSVAAWYLWRACETVTV